MLLTVLACVVGYLAVGVLVAFVGGVWEVNTEADHFAVCIFFWPVVLPAALTVCVQRAATATREALAARKPPTEDEL